MKNINFEVPDDTYFKFQEIKAKKKCKNWLELFSKMMEEVGAE